MFNFMTICESVKRHWIAIVVVTALCLGAGAALSFVRNGEVHVASTYTAEATLYVTGYGYDEAIGEAGGQYNYSYNEQYAISEVRRIILSSEVAGTVRESYGEDVMITNPSWIDKPTNSPWTLRFVFVDATANDPDTALAAANEVAERTVEVAKERLPIEDIVVHEPAVLKSGTSEAAADWGVDGFVSDAEESPAVASVVSGISLKNLVVFGFVGVFGSVFVFAAYDILSRRVRSARDVERLLDVPVLASVKGVSDFGAVAESVSALAVRNNLKHVLVAGASEKDDAREAFEALKGSVSVEVSEVSLSDAGAVNAAMQADAVLLVLRSAASTGAQLGNALKRLGLAGTPVLGAVFIERRR